MMMSASPYYENYVTLCIAIRSQKTQVIQSCHFTCYTQMTAYLRKGPIMEPQLRALRRSPNYISAAPDSG